MTGQLNTITGGVAAQQSAAVFSTPVSSSIGSGTDNDDVTNNIEQSASSQTSAAPSSSSSSSSSTTPTVSSQRLFDDPTAGVLVTEQLNSQGLITQQTPSGAVLAYLRDGLSVNGFPKQSTSA